MARVLIVDAEKSIRVSLREFLVAEGYTVETTADAQEALQFLGNHDVDVVVSDIILPGVNGVELLKAIRQTAPDVQVIMMTGEPTVETAAEAVRAGASDYLTKPASKSAIIRSVATAARIKALDEERRREQEAKTRVVSRKCCDETVRHGKETASGNARRDLPHFSMTWPPVMGRAWPVS